MQTSDFYEFKELWTTYSDVINCTSKPSDKAIAIIFEKLLPYEISDIAEALDRVVSSDVFALKISDVLNELEDRNPDEIRERANIAFHTVYNILSYPGTGYSYIFEDVAVDHTLYALGWDMEFLNSAKFDEVYSKKDFVSQYLISAQKAKSLKHLVLKGSCTAENHTKLVSASKTSYGNPVTWTLSEEDKEIILLGNEDSDNAVKRITAELPKIPVLPDEEKRDPAPPADIRRQKEIIEKTMNALLGVKEGD